MYLIRNKKFELQLAKTSPIMLLCLRRCQWLQIECLQVLVSRTALVLFTELNRLMPVSFVIPQGRTFLVSDHCLQHAFSLHQNLCSSLLLAYQGLFGYFTCITKDLPSSHRMELGILHCGFTPTNVRMWGCSGL